MNNLNLQGGGVLRPTRPASLGRRGEESRPRPWPSQPAVLCLPSRSSSSPLPFPIYARHSVPGGSSSPSLAFRPPPSVSDPLITPRVPLSLIRRSAGSLLSRRTDPAATHALRRPPRTGRTPLDPDPGIVPQQLHLFPLPYAYSSFSSLSELARVGDPSSIGYDGVAN